MQHLDCSGTPVLYIGRTVLKGYAKHVHKRIQKKYVDIYSAGSERLTKQSFYRTTSCDELLPGVTLTSYFCSFTLHFLDIRLFGNP